MKTSQEHAHCCESTKKQKPVETERHLLEVQKIVAADSTGDDVEMTENLWTTVVKKDITKTLKSVPVIRANTSKKGTATIEFTNKDDLADAEKALETTLRH